MKKCFVVLLCLILASSSFSSLAVENNYPLVFTDTSVDLYTPEEFLRIFKTNQSSSANFSFHNTIDQVNYSYTFNVCEYDPKSASVSLSFTILSNGQSYHSDVTGIVDAYELSSGDILWEGPVRGKIYVGEIEYHVVASFSKLNSSPDIQVNVTIQSLNTHECIYPINFSFGSDVITSDIYHQLDINSVEIDATNSDTVNINSTLSTNAFVYIGSSSGTLIAPPYSVSAQTLRGYFNSTTNQLAVSLISYCNDVKEMANINSLIDASAYVDSFEIRLQSNSYGQGSNHSWIDNLCSYSFSEFDTSTIIKPLFEDTLSLLGVPTSTISSMLDGLKGTVSESVYADIATVSIDFGLLQKANFDESSIGLPLLFQLDCVPSTYSGNSSYTFSSSITYRVWKWFNSQTVPRNFFYDGYDATRVVTITLT